MESNKVLDEKYELVIKAFEEYLESTATNESVTLAGMATSQHIQSNILLGIYRELVETRHERRKER